MHHRQEFVIVIHSLQHVEPMAVDMPPKLLHTSIELLLCR